MFLFDIGCWDHLGSRDLRTRPWPSRMSPCPPQQSRNRVTQLPIPEDPGEMELTWQEIMSITELQVSQAVGNKVVGEGKAAKQGVWLGSRPWVCVAGELALEQAEPRVSRWEIFWTL